ncbi:lantibiotic dehydratase family protein [Chryseobacterium sp. SG20098]|uniref:lantibiotic dehydratase family protein n=1 Tax=Chryseobacterium sp. SG20098 TaxID=3074145 RepID=UPI0028833E35|nr:lantibiotic dehydratase family protein [Chryseobacterium sp. SG20098]WNI34774.1 lantibiotic dehydratase family protein [Chryseobacterium sp. SG20098]
MSRFPYQFFDEYVVRTHSFSRRNFQQAISSKGEITDAEQKEICTNPIFQEAIYLASPNLYEELTKWINSEKQFLPKEHQKLKHTLLKYYSRISTRCTPFGLFSAVGLGNFSLDIPNTFNNKTENHQFSTDNLLRDTKLDMYFLVSLAQYFVQQPEIRNKLLFYPNNSIYKVGSRIRYIEYQYTRGKREYIISLAPLSEELQQILNFSKEGKTIQQIAEILINEKITQEEAIEFVEELLDNQVLISELEPNVSGNDFLDEIISVLNKIEAKDAAEILISIKNKLNELDQNISNPISRYAEIDELIQSFAIEYERKYLFQADLYNKALFHLPLEWKKKLKKGISFLNKITLSQREGEFSKFKKAFSERFEGQELPLLYVLDNEVGIGYKQNVSSKGIHPYLEDLIFPASLKNQNKNIELTSVHQILNEKVQEALFENQYSIELSDEDFKDFEENWDDLPDTISIMTEIFSDNNQEKLFFSSIIGSTAANFLGRFCSEKSKVRNLTKDITKKEQELNPEEILAEIIHLPEARIGNVIRRPTLRQYEIPYLAQSLLPAENQIPVEDLYISLRNDRIVLRSKKLNKEVKPYLTNAHNYYTNTLPVYHFLSDLYSQNIRSGLYFSWGGLEHIYTFLPRVEYDNIILSKARWKVTEKDISSLELLSSDKEDFLLELKNWRSKRKIPAWIQWVKFDNTLTMNLENYDMAKLFIQAVRNEKSIIIEEFLYNENDDFKREFIFPMYREKK